MHGYETVSEVRQALAPYFDFYNRRRPHSTLDGQTPHTAYFNQQNINLKKPNFCPTARGHLWERPFGHHTMKAKLKRMCSLEWARPLEELRPDDETNFGISIRLVIGIEDSPGEESFDILACTPEWIKSQYAEEKCVWGGHMLIVFEYDIDLIKHEVDRYIARCTGGDWLTIARKLREMGAWEFEGYHS